MADKTHVRTENMPFAGGAASLTELIAFAGTLGLPTTFSPITYDVDGATITFNLAVTNWHTVTLGGNRTLALSNPTVGQQFSIILIQDGTGSRTVTWFPTVKWPSATPPTLTTTAGGIDVFTFKIVGAGVIYGFTAGQAMG
jgi:hypothetical protein